MTLLCYYVYMAFRQIKAKVPSFARFEAELLKDIDKPFKVVKQDFEQFIATWKTKPELIIDVQRKGDRITIFSGVENNWVRGGKATAEDIFMFLARGTTRKFIIWTDDFRPKTKPGVLRSSRGAGKVFYSPGNPLPGIEKRDTEAIVKRRNERFLRTYYSQKLRDAVIRSGATKL